MIGTAVVSAVIVGVARAEAAIAIAAYASGRCNLRRAPGSPGDQCPGHKEGDAANRGDDA